MTWDPVPWFVGGGAQHSPEVARLLAYAATSGAEGIIGTADLKVRELAVPGASIRVDAGAALIRDTTSGMPQQTYVARLASEDTVEVTPTGSGGGRSDLVVARIEDPYVPGAPWQEPTDPTVGPYVHTRLITDVPAGTTSVAALGLGYSAVALARIDIPASTGTITADMITDLRRVAFPRRERVLRSGQLYSPTVDPLDADVEEAWPDPSVMEWSVDVPEWATEMNIVMTWGGVAHSGNFLGWVWARITDSGIDVDTAKTRVNTSSISGEARHTITVAANTPIPAELRGRDNVRLVGRGNRTSGSGYLELDGGSVMWADVEFVMGPEQ